MNAERTEGSQGAGALGTPNDTTAACEHIDPVTNNQPNQVYTTKMVRNVLNGFVKPLMGAFSFCLEIN